MIVNLTFPGPLNMSCRIGDTTYFVSTAVEGGFTVAGEPTILGTVNSITQIGTDVVVEVQVIGEDINEATLTTNSYIFFSKNNLVEIGSILGYYGVAQFRNNSTMPAELHATACEIEESSE